MKKPISIFWFRRDLRTYDNAGLYAALQGPHPVLPVFIFDTGILDHLERPRDRRVSFIHSHVANLKRELESAGSSLLTLYGNPEQVMESLNDQYAVSAVYANHDYEPYAIRRDHSINRILSSNGIAFHTFKDQVILEKNEVMKDDGKPYTVFTPYMRKWKATLDLAAIPEFPSAKHLDRLLKTPSFLLVSLQDMGFIDGDEPFPEGTINTDIIGNYDQTRDYPSLNGTSRLGPHLRFGTISIRDLVKTAAGLNDTFLNELIWREFYMMILWHFPFIEERAFRPAYDNMLWRNNEEEFRAWCNGQTGYPLVDAGMRELNQTGYMHNRIRMVCASFLTKHLLIDWRWGEKYFADKLLDFELSSNNGGWQWAAGTGCDAAPYFRIFNPESQQKKFDPKTEYIRKYVPEFGTASYPKPIVEHKFARERALRAYQEVL